MQSAVEALQNMKRVKVPESKSLFEKRCSRLNNTDHRHIVVEYNISDTKSLTESLDTGCMSKEGKYNSVLNESQDIHRVYPGAESNIPRVEATIAFLKEATVTNVEYKENGVFTSIELKESKQIEYNFHLYGYTDQDLEYINRKLNK